MPIDLTNSATAGSIQVIGSKRYFFNGTKWSPMAPCEITEIPNGVTTKVFQTTAQLPVGQLGDIALVLDVNKILYHNGSGYFAGGVS